tara:strand:- start:302 stop:511 length:210 start_codon:yes stop_codon:yes gene_type:complete
LIDQNNKEYVVYYIYFFKLTAYCHLHGLITITLAQSEGYQLFEKYIEIGAPKDKFDCFELKSRVNASHT